MSSSDYKAEAGILLIRKKKVCSLPEDGIKSVYSEHSFESGTRDIGRPVYPATNDSFAVV
jgi:hypothetical protein